QELISKIKALLVGVEPAGLEAPASADVLEITESSFAEEPQFVVEATVEEDKKNEYEGIVDEESLSKADLMATDKVFEEELAEALKGDASVTSGVSGLIDNLVLPSKEDILEVVKQSVEKRLSDIFGSDSVTALSAAVKEVVSATLAQNAPKIIGDVTKELVTEMMQSLHGEISAAIGRIVPEVAETIIKREIEKITVQS